MKEPRNSQDDGRIKRRTIVAAAAWTAPVIATAVAAPFAAASTCSNPTVFSALLPTANGVTSTAGRTTTFTVPAGVTRIEYEVTGGAGGGRNATRAGGPGARAIGKLAVTPGTVLTLIVGQGGASAPVNSQAAAVAGGQGHGNGGGSGPSGTNVFQGGSGGGGSAILVGASTVVIAGGGGGAGSGVIFPGGNQTQFTPIGSTASIPGGGAAGGRDASDSRLQWATPAGNVNRTVQAFGGDTAPTYAGGVQATAAQVTGAPVFARSSVAGGNGSPANLAGSNGGAGSTTTYVGQDAGTIPDFLDAQGRAMGFTAGGSGGGGGGGGYGGGGGGGAQHAFWQRGTAANSSAGILGTGAGGAGGGSLISTAAVGGVTPVPGSSSVNDGNNANPTEGVRVPGSIIIRYCPAV